MKATSGRQLIALLTVPKFELGRPIGGAEAIADQLVRCLSSYYDIVVLHGYEGQRGQCRGRCQITPKISTCEAFPVTDEIRYGGVISGELLSAEARELLARSNALISFERVVDLGLQCNRYAVLGGVGYSHCKELATSRHWDYLVVPSIFVRDTLVENGLDRADRMLVIPNGINLDMFFPIMKKSALDAEGRIVLLIPSRPDCGKGFEISFTFAKACKEAGFRVVVRCLRQQSVPSSELFYDNLYRSADRLNVELEVLPWVSRSEMPDIYHRASLTLCLGDLPEGFCLVAAESIACGTPVLARAVGFLRYIFPANHGLRSITSNIDLTEAAVGLTNWVKKAGTDCLERGVPFVRDKYSEDFMIKSYLSLLTSAY